MSKIALLLPYPEMVESARKVIRELHTDIDYVRAIESVNAVNEARRAVEAGARVIVARGYQAMLIKGYMNVPVIEMRVHAQEMGLLIAQARKLVKKDVPHIGILVYSNTLCDMSHMEELMGARLSFAYINRSEETAARLMELVRKEPDILIGGRGLCAEAERLGYPAIFMKAENESIAEAIKEAKSLLFAIENEQLNTAQFEAVLDTSAGAVIKLNAEGKVIVANKTMEDLVGKNSEDIIGRELSELLPDVDEKSIMGLMDGEVETYSASVNIRRTAWMLLAAPIRYDSKITGAIISLQRISGNLGRQHRAMQDMYLNGFTATKSFSDIRTNNAEMKEALGKAKKYALSDSPVLMMSGEGTEFYAIAESIHNNSRRKAGPFVSLRIRGLDKSQQIEALFGRAEAAGDAREGGALTKANHGTVLIKGIEHLTLEAQHRIIRLLRPHSVSRTDARPIDTLDVRIIAVSKVNLRPLVATGRFSEEFFYLISGLTVEVPGLARRPEDLLDRFDEYFKMFSKRYSKYSVLTQGGRDALLSLDFKGNLLQLKAFTERLVLEVDRHSIDELIIRKLYRELYPEVRPSEDGNLKLVVYKSPEGMKIEELLEKFGGSRAKVAEELGISTTTLWRKMKKYGVEPRFRG
ncbi:MAG: PrpR N-terminal domain-containing protein [Lachnospiraceae bacterium]|nr:PrpR N-terminal domain-containing protein [Lachnospiraceae bacterium]